MAKPIVDGIENDLQGQARVIRLSVMSAVGRSAAQQYGVRSIPTIIVFGADGRPIDHIVGVPNRKSVVAQVADLSQ